MMWNRTAAAIAAAWKAELENKQEAGATLLLNAGAPSLAYGGLATLLAFQSWMAQRTDMTTPTLVAGGSSPLWLGLLLGPTDGTGAPEPAVVFGGPDPATFQASVATSASGIAIPPAMVAAGTPAEYTTWLAPRLQPGAVAPWEALPFVEIGERPQPSLVANDTRPMDPTADWIAWGTMLLALCLVLSALLI
jgi:hypothetical protein